MAWIELHQSLWTHKKTILLAAILDIDEIYAAAHMAKLWTWSLDNAPEGDLSNLPSKVIAFGAGWKDDPDQFVAAVVDAGWIDRDGESTLLHDWYDYAGRLIEKKAANKERAKKSRSVRVACAQQSRNEQATNAHVAGLPNLTLPNLTIPNNESVLSDPKERLRILANQLKFKGLGIDGLETIHSYIGRADIEVIEKAMKLAEGKHVNYFVSIINGFIDEGRITKESIEPKAGDYAEKADRKQRTGSNPKGDSEASGGTPGYYEQYGIAQSL